MLPMTEAQTGAPIAVVLISLAADGVLASPVFAQTVRAEFRTVRAEIRGMCRESAPGPHPEPSE